MNSKNRSPDGFTLKINSSSVALEASQHRKKIAFLRQNFLTDKPINTEVSSSTTTLKDHFFSYKSVELGILRSKSVNHIEEIPENTDDCQHSSVTLYPRSILSTSKSHGHLFESSLNETPQFIVSSPHNSLLPNDPLAAQIISLTKMHGCCSSFKSASARLNYITPKESLSPIYALANGSVVVNTSSPSKRTLSNTGFSSVRSDACKDSGVDSVHVSELYVGGPYESELTQNRFLPLHPELLAAADSSKASQTSHFIYLPSLGVNESPSRIALTRISLDNETTPASFHASFSAPNGERYSPIDNCSLEAKSQVAENHNFAVHVDNGKCDVYPTHWTDDQYYHVNKNHQQLSDKFYHLWPSENKSDLVFVSMNASQTPLPTNETYGHCSQGSISNESIYNSKAMAGKQFSPLNRRPSRRGRRRSLHYPNQPGLRSPFKRESRSVGDLKRRQIRSSRSSSYTSSSSCTSSFFSPLTESLTSLSSPSSTEYLPCVRTLNTAHHFGSLKCHQLLCNNVRKFSDRDKLALDQLAMRIQPMLMEGRSTEVNDILLRALTQPDTRERALELIDYFSESLNTDLVYKSLDRSRAGSRGSFGHADGLIPSLSRLRFSREHCSTSGPMSSKLSSINSCTPRGGTVKRPLAPRRTGAEENGDDEDESSGIYGLDDSAASTSLTSVSMRPSGDIGLSIGKISSNVVKVTLPAGGVVEPPPPPARPLPPPKPAPPNLPKSAIMPNEERLAQLDAHVLQMLDYNPLLMTDLVAQLTMDCSADVEIARRLFRWVVCKDFRKINYDPEAPTDSFLGLLRNVKLGVLSNNDLFHELCRFAGLHSQYISGRSKGAGYRPGMQLKKESLFCNTWLAVYVGGSWRFVNCNWAARYHCSWTQPLFEQSRAEANLSDDLSMAAKSSSGLSSLATSRFRCDEFYFFTDPTEHIFEHLPDKKSWQLLSKPISRERFIALPLLKSPFFNAQLSLKKPYSDRLVTKNGQVSVKLRMPRFVGISCSLENCADGSVLKGLCLVEVLISPADVVRVLCAPSQPGRYYLNIYVSPDWRRDDIRELACSFLVQCSEYNYSRLVVMGRLPEVGFLGRTPAAQHFGFAMCPTSSRNHGNRPYILHSSSDSLKLSFAISPGLRICHQLKSFDRPGQQMADCDNFALLQMHSSSLTSPSHGLVSTPNTGNAHYYMRFPVSAFFYLTVYAAYTVDSATDHLECVHRLLVDARRPTTSSYSATDGGVLPLPRQTYWWVGFRLLEPTKQSLEINRKHKFRLDAPCAYTSIAVVINCEDWHFLKLIGGAPPGARRWAGKIPAGSNLGELSVYGSCGSIIQSSVAASSSDGVSYVKLLDYTLVHGIKSA